MATAKKRVAITGLGLVTPAGNDVASTWATLLAGRSQGAPITTFDASGFSTRIAAEVKGFDPRAILDDRRLLKFANRAHAFALGALAMRAAGGGARVVGMQDVKVRAFMPPGETLAVSAEIADDGEGVAGRVLAKMQGKPVATARVRLARDA